jgi:hypothetical protein
MATFPRATLLLPIVATFEHRARTPCFHTTVLFASVKAPKLLSNMGTTFLCFDAHTTLHYVFGNFLLFNFYCFGASQDDREHASNRARDGKMLFDAAMSFGFQFGIWSI